MKILSLVLLTTLLAGCGTAPTVQELTAAYESYGRPLPPETIVAEVVSIQDHPSSLQAPCPSNGKCISPLWYIYRARVSRVLTGQQIGPEISFANLQHDGFTDAAKKQMFVFLTAANASERERLKVEFVAYRVLVKPPGQRNWSGG